MERQPILFKDPLWSPSEVLWGDLQNPGVQRAKEVAMPISPYLARLRSRIGHDLLLMAGVAAVIHNSDGEVLCIRRSDTGAWSLPAGAVDPGETPAEAIIREVHEETGLVFQPTVIVGVTGGLPCRTVYPNGDQVEYTVIVFQGVVLDGTLEPLDGEADGFAYWPLDQLPLVTEAYPHPFFVPAASRAAWFRNYRSITEPVWG